MREESLHEIAILRHSIHINNRLRLEIIASLSRLFREFDVPITDELLAELILAVPAELNGTKHETPGQLGNHSVYSFDGPSMPWEPPEPPAPPAPPLPPEPPEPRNRRSRSKRQSYSSRRPA